MARRTKEAPAATQAAADASSSGPPAAPAATLLVLLLVLLPWQALAAAQRKCKAGDLGVPSAADCTAALCEAQLAAQGDVVPRIYSGNGGLCCACELAGAADAAPAPAPMLAAAAAASALGSTEPPAAPPPGGLTAQASPPSSGATAAAAAAPASGAGDAAPPRGSALVKAVLQLDAAPYPLSDAKARSAAGALGGLTAADWSYRAQQPATASGTPKLPAPGVAPWYLAPNLSQAAPADLIGVWLFGEPPLLALPVVLRGLGAWEWGVQACCGLPRAAAMPLLGPS